MPSSKVPSRARSSRGGHLCRHTIFMPELVPAPDPAVHAPHVPKAVESVARKRPKPGERRVQILEALASMLELPGAERVTTASLAARLNVSEAALYRHFASKAQMFEGLIEFTEQAVFGLVNQINERQVDPTVRVRKLVMMVLQFAEKNPGLTRVMVGDALVYEHERLQARMNLFFDKLEAAIKQNLRGTVVSAQAADGLASGVRGGDAQARASVVVAFVAGRLQRFARSGFRRLPTEHLEASLVCLLK